MTATAAVAAAILSLVAIGPVLRRLPEPAQPDGKIPYAALATRRFILTTAVVVALAVVVPGLTLPAASQPAWWALALGGGWLAAIDFRTTWLPLRLTRPAWLLMGVAVSAAAIVAGDWRMVIHAAGGAAAALLVFWLPWRFLRGGIGFGDVRFAPLIGAPAAAYSWELWFAALVLGTSVGALLATVRAVRRRPGPFAYAPCLFAGPYAACLLSGPLHL